MGRFLDWDTSRGRFKELERLVWLGCSCHLGLAEGVWIPHQNLLLRLESNVVKLWCIVAANTGTARSTVAIVRKAFAVELQTLGSATVAGLVGRLSRFAAISRGEEAELGVGRLHTGMSMVVHDDVARVDLESLRERVLQGRD